MKEDSPGQAINPSLGASGGQLQLSRMVPGWCGTGPGRWESARCVFLTTETGPLGHHPQVRALMAILPKKQTKQTTKMESPLIPKILQMEMEGWKPSFPFLIYPSES